MRSEQEMFDLITRIAAEDARIRAVILNGSRANPNVRRDPFQDFDVVYIVTDVSSFRENHAWIEQFGELMILQMPEEMKDPPPSNDGTFIYLMQFTDGNRIDLALFPVAQLSEFHRDSLSMLLLDKDDIIEPFPPPSEADYLPSPPTAKRFADCCNEFWWVSTYVAKGLWREELLYAKHMHDQVVRQQLMTMLTWRLGADSDFSQSLGKLGKHFQQMLAPELWEMLVATYADGDLQNSWDALLRTGDLFRSVAIPLAEELGFEYPHDDDRRVSAHLRHVRSLPKSATKIY